MPIDHKTGLSTVISTRPVNGLSYVFEVLTIPPNSRRVLSEFARQIKQEFNILKTNKILFFDYSKF